MEKINLQLSEKESRFKSYYEYLKKLADKLVEDPNSSETSDFITNEGEIHASILMGTLLSNTEENVRMYSSGLSPKLLCGETEDNYEEQTAYWKEFKAFFENINYFPKRTSDTQVDKPIKILVKKDIWKKNLPLQKVRQAMLAYPKK